jgi:hypothetical protein
MDNTTTSYVSAGIQDIDMTMMTEMQCY